MRWQGVDLTPNLPVDLTPNLPEDELGVQLFKRERFGLALTPAGEKLLVYARQILDLSNEATRVLHNQPAVTPNITVGFITSKM